MAASGVTLGSDCSGPFSGESLSNPSWLSNITKITIAFKPELSTQLGAYAPFKVNPYAFFWTWVSYVHH